MEQNCNAAPKAFGARLGCQSRISLFRCRAADNRSSELFESLASRFAFRCSAPLT